MTDVYQQNLQQISQRWPEIGQQLLQLPASTFHIEPVIHEGVVQTLKIDGIHLTSAYDRLREAELQLQVLPDQPEDIHLYGFALGDQLELALDRYEVPITLHILNLALFNTILGYIDARELFNDRRVTIKYDGGERSIRSPFAVSPAELQLADDACLALRDELQISLASDYISERYNAERDTWLQQIADNYPLIEGDHDVAELFATRVGEQAVIVAAGPSLASLYDRIDELRQQGALIIGVDAVLKPLVEVGIEPDYLLTIEGQRDKLLRFYEPNILHVLQHTKLVYFPVVHHDVLESWPGERYTAYAGLDIYRQVAQDLPRGQLFVSGTVTHPAVDLAVKMGCSNIYFAGLDFGYPGNRSHVTGSFYAEEVKAQGHEKLILNGHGESIRTIQNLIVYLRDLERYIRLQAGVNFHNLSREGARIEGAEYVNG